jgi:hypothetical protein
MHPNAPSTKPWLNKLVILNVLLWIVADIAARADDSDSSTYVFAKVEIGTGVYGSVKGPVYFSEVVKVSLDRFSNHQDNLKEIVKRDVQRLLGTDEKISFVTLMNDKTFATAEHKRSDEINSVKNNPYLLGRREVKEFAESFTGY